MNENNRCPICKTKIIKKQISKDLIALNILNDMQVTCNNLGKLHYYNNIECPWKGTLSELVRHLGICPFDEKRISENIKKHLNKASLTDTKSKYQEDDSNTGDYLGFNPKNASLKARLFQKNPALMSKVLNDEGKEPGYLDIYSFIGVDRKHIPDSLINATKLENQDKNNLLEGNKSKDVDDYKIDECDINYIYTNKDDINITDSYPNTNNNIITIPNSNNERNDLLKNKRKRKINTNNNNNNHNLIKEEKDQINSSNNSLNDLEEDEERELEYALQISLKEYEKDSTSIFDNENKN